MRFGTTNPKKGLWDGYLLLFIYLASYEAKYRTRFNSESERKAASRPSVSRLVISNCVIVPGTCVQPYAIYKVLLHQKLLWLYLRLTCEVCGAGFPGDEAARQGEVASLGHTAKAGPNLELNSSLQPCKINHRDAHPCTPNKPMHTPGIHDSSLHNQ